MKLTTIPQLYRHVGRWSEIIAVLSKYGMADWLSQFDLEFTKGLLKAKDGEVLARLSREARIRMVLTELGPTFIKLGQILSTRPDLIGVELANELQGLLVNVPPDGPDIVRAAIESELGQPLEELFAEFDEIAVASASIGQVHRARLLTGQRVAVKVQRAGIDEKVRVDMDILTGLAHLAEGLPELANYRPKATLAEFQRMLRRELDFGREERNILQFGRDYAETPGVRIPGVYSELCTPKVLTMDWLEGVSLCQPERLRTLDLDLDDIAHRGANLYLEMIFTHGVYHADPHPGNILVLEDGTIGLLDFGMVGRIDEPLREQIEEMLMALAGQDTEQLTRVIMEIGDTPPDLDETALDEQRRRRRAIGGLDFGFRFGVGNHFFRRRIGRFRVACGRLILRHRHLIDDDIDAVAVKAVADRRARHRHDRLCLAGEHHDVGEHAGEQTLVGVLENGPHQDVAGILLDLRVDRFDVAGKGFARERIDAHLDGLSDRDLCDLLLRNRKVGVDGRELLQGHQRRTRRDILAQIDQPDTEQAAKRCLDRFLRDQRPNALDGGRRRIATCDAVVQSGFRRVTALEQFLLTAECQVRFVQRSEARFQIGLFNLVVELHEQRTSGHGLTRIELQRSDHAADLRGDVDTLHRLQRADRRQDWHPGLLLRFRRRDRDRRERARAHEFRNKLRLHDELEIGEAADQHDKQDQDGGEDGNAFHAIDRTDKRFGEWNEGGGGSHGDWAGASDPQPHRPTAIASWRFCRGCRQVRLATPRTPTAPTTAASFSPAHRHA